MRHGVNPLVSCGSDLQGVRTYAKKDGSDWILNGNKVKPLLFL